MKHYPYYLLKRLVAPPVILTYSILIAGLTVIFYTWHHILFLLSSYNAVAVLTKNTQQSYSILSQENCLGYIEYRFDVDEQETATIFGTGKIFLRYKEQTITLETISALIFNSFGQLSNVTVNLIWPMNYIKLSINGIKNPTLSVTYLVDPATGQEQHYQLPMPAYFSLDRNRQNQDQYVLRYIGPEQQKKTITTAKTTLASFGIDLQDFQLTPITPKEICSISQKNSFDISKFFILAGSLTHWAQSMKDKTQFPTIPIP